MDWFEEKDILARIKAHDVAGARKKLPAADVAQQEELEVDHHVPGIGLVRFTMKRKRAKHHKHSHMFWIATKAVLLQ